MSELAASASRVSVLCSRAGNRTHNAYAETRHGLWIERAGAKLETVGWRTTWDRLTRLKINRDWRPQAGQNRRRWLAETAESDAGIPEWMNELCRLVSRLAWMSCRCVRAGAGEERRSTQHNLGGGEGDDKNSRRTQEHWWTNGTMEMLQHLSSYTINPHSSFGSQLGLEPRTSSSWQTLEITTDDRKWWTDPSTPTQELSGELETKVDRSVVHSKVAEAIGEHPILWSSQQIFWQWWQQMLLLRKEDKPNSKVKRG